MQSKEQDVKTPSFSRVLFVTVDGEPMTFFLRPGPTKRKIQPLITAGGGTLCNVQQPGAILLIDPEEQSRIPETTAHWYVSTQYIHDCVKKDDQLNLEDYKLNPEVAPRQYARLNNNKDTSLSGGRAAYTAEEDAAILSHVSKHKAEVGGNRLWQEMEKQRVTSHSWQSMKYRYRVRLAKLQTEAVKAATTEKGTEAAVKETDTAEEETENEEAETETKKEAAETEEETEVTELGEENQEAILQNPSGAEDVASPPTTSAETDSTQIDAQSIPCDSTQPEMVEAQTSVSLEEEVQCVDLQTDEQPAQSPQAETAEDETSEGPCVDPDTDAHPDPAESTEQETDDSQTAISSKDESVPEDSPPAQINTCSKKKSKEKHKMSPEREQPQRRLTRRQLVLEELLSPEPYAKRLRSSASSPGGLSSSPELSKKTKSAAKSVLLSDKTVEQPPLKRARGKSVVESPQEESEQAAVPETPQAETEANSAPQKAEKKKEKRKLGILELATKEFEDDSEISDEEVTPDLQNQNETATGQSTTAEPALHTSDTAAETTSKPSNPEPELSLQENTQEAPSSSSNCPPNTGGPEPAATEAATPTSKAHLFIFDSETQEADSQSVIGDNPIPPSNLQPTVNDDAAPSLTQVQLEEDKQRIRELMGQTNKDLVSVTKALLLTSGDFSAALDLLLNPSSSSGPFWTRQEDSLLLSADPVVRQQLQEKYSEEEVAKRIVFLEVEG